MRDLPGYGDPETWGAPTGHPNDPRTEGDYECPLCDAPATLNGCSECNYRLPEPDYEDALYG